MLRYLLGLAGMALFFIGTILAQFEGIMDMKVRGADVGKDDSILYTMTIKKNLMATEIKNPADSNGTGKFIFRGDKQVVWILNDEEKSYFEISLKDEAKSEKQKKKSEAEESPAKVKRTGNKETILGYLCEEVIIEGDDEITHIWGTQKLGDLYGTMMRSFAEMGTDEEGDRLRGWDDEIKKLTMFPLKVVSKENNKVVLTQEVTNIQQKSVPETVFDIPKGYKKQSFEFDILNMMKQMQKEGKDHKEADKDDPGKNIDMEKMMQHLKDAQKEDPDTTDGGF